MGSVTDASHLRGGQAFFHRTVVAGQHFGVERARQIEILEPRQVEIGERGAAHGPRVEGRVPVAPFLVEYPFVLRAGQRPAGSDPRPDSTAEAHRRGIGRRDGHHGHVLAAEHVLADRHRRRRQDVAVRLAVGELEQQGVVDFQTGGRAVVPHTDEDHPRTAPIRQIIGERADGLAHGTRRIAVEGLLALDEVRLDVGHHHLEFDVRIGGAHASFRKLADHSMVAYRPRPYRAAMAAWQSSQACPGGSSAGDRGTPAGLPIRRPAPQSTLRATATGPFRGRWCCIVSLRPMKSATTALPERIRGFGHVKGKSIEEAQHREAELLERFRAAADPSAAA